ncbi:imelysin family protein [Roseibium sp. MB-4]
MKRILVSAAAALMTWPAVAADLTQPIEKMIAGYIQPEIRVFADVATRLPEAVQEVCQAPTDEAKSDFKVVFSDAVGQFARIHFLRLGPLIEEDRISRLAFQPDPRGIAQRQIRKLYGAQDESVRTAESLSEKSVALQGLTALQLIAFDKTGAVVLGEVGERGDFTCSYALAISENVAGIAQDVMLSWFDADGFSKTLLETGGSNARYQTDKEALEDVFQTLSTALIVVRDQNIAPALGSSEEKARPNRIPFSRSDNGVVFLTSEMNGILDAIQSMDLEPMMPEEHAWLIGSMTFEFENAMKTLNKLPPPLRETFEPSGAYGQLSLLVISLNSLQRLVGERVAGALGLAGGFNALDGD